jgi:uncharacterized membrane protein
VRTLLSVDVFFVVGGLLLAGVGVRVLREATGVRHRASGIGWLLCAGVFGAGSWLPAEVSGAGVIAGLGLLAWGRRPERGPETGAAERRTAGAARLGDRLFLPTLVIPACVIGGAWLFPEIAGNGWRFIDPAQTNALALAIACGAGGLLALGLTREPPGAALNEGAGLLGLLGWALFLPQVLASLGGVFAKTGVGEEVARLLALALPLGVPWVAVVAYAGGMALFTVVMGNAFAAFPVMTLGIGVPFVIRMHGGDPALTGALGMVCGYCGTLVTPMAANFNLVPAVLLGLGDRTAVIRAQAPFAALLWVFNVALMLALVYRV